MLHHSVILHHMALQCTITFKYYISSYQIIQNNIYKSSPVGLMSIHGQPAMIKERNQVNGLFGLSMINKKSNNYNYSSLNILLNDRR